MSSLPAFSPPATTAALPDNKLRAVRIPALKLREIIPAVKIPEMKHPGDETVSFIVTFDTQGGSALADITVENGQVIGEFTFPTKQCSRLVGFALDTAGEQMWNVLTDTVSANITLYAIWEDAHTWSEWADTTPATCTENGP